MSYFTTLSPTHPQSVAKYVKNILMPYTTLRLVDINFKTITFELTSCMSVAKTISQFTKEGLFTQSNTATH